MFWNCACMYCECECVCSIPLEQNGMFKSACTVRGGSDRNHFRSQSLVLGVALSMHAFGVIYSYSKVRLMILLPYVSGVMHNNLVQNHDVSKICRDHSQPLLEELLQVALKSKM